MRKTIIAAAGVALASLTGATAADAVTFTYEGATLYAGSAGLTGDAISGSIRFDDAAFAPGATLTAEDIADFAFTVAGYEFDRAGASFVAASFTVNADGDGFDAWGLMVEQRLDGFHRKPEVLALGKSRALGQPVRLSRPDDRRPGRLLTKVRALAYNTGVPGRFPAVPSAGSSGWRSPSPSADIPLPAPALLLLSGLAGPRPGGARHRPGLIGVTDLSHKRGGSDIAAA